MDAGRSELNLQRDSASARPRGSKPKSPASPVSRVVVVYGRAIERVSLGTYRKEARSSIM